MEHPANLFINFENTIGCLSSGDSLQDGMENATTKAGTSWNDNWISTSRYSNEPNELESGFGMMSGDSNSAGHRHPVVGVKGVEDNLTQAQIWGGIMSATIGTIIITVLLSVVVYTVFALLTNNKKGCCSQLHEKNGDSSDSIRWKWQIELRNIAK